MYTMTRGAMFPRVPSQMMAPLGAGPSVRPAENNNPNPPSWVGAVRRPCCRKAANGCSDRPLAEPVEFLSQQPRGDLRVRLAARRTHHLPNEESQDLLLALQVLLHGLGVGLQGLPDDL